MSRFFGQKELEIDKSVPLVIFGAGEFARLATHYFQNDSGLNVKCYVVSDEFMHNYSDRTFLGKELYSESEYFLADDLINNNYFVAYTATKLSLPRLNKVEQLKNKGLRCISYLSSKSFVDSDVSIADNVFIFENNTLQSEVSIGDATVIWSGNHIGHQTTLGRGNFISSHVCVGGRVNIRNNCYFGMNSTVRDMLEVADRTVLGACSFLNQDSKGNEVLVGIPAKKIENKNPMDVIK